MSDANTKGSHINFANYMKSCFISLIFTLVFIIIVTRFFLDKSTVYISLTASLIFICGITSPLAFYFAGKYTTTIKESARPHIVKAKNNTTNVEIKKNNESQKIIEQQQPVPVSKQKNISDTQNITNHIQLMLIYISGISQSCKSNNIRILFNSYSKDIYDLKIIKDRKTFRNKGIGFIKMPSVAGKKAIKELNGKSFYGSTITLREASQDDIKEYSKYK